MLGVDCGYINTPALTENKAKYIYYLATRVPGDNDEENGLRLRQTHRGARAGRIFFRKQDLEDFKLA